MVSFFFFGSGVLYECNYNNTDVFADHSCGLLSFCVAGQCIFKSKRIKNSYFNSDEFSPRLFYYLYNKANNKIKTNESGRYLVCLL